MSYDFYGVQLRGLIRRFGRDNENEVIELWTPSNHEELRALSFLQEIQVTVKLGLVSELSIVLAPPFDDGIRLLNSGLIKWGIGHLVVQFGYTTASQEMSFPWSGLLLYPEVQISGSDISITLKATGVGYPMSAAGATEEVSYPGMTVNEVVESVLAKYAKSRLFKLDLDKLYPDISAADRSSLLFFKPVVKTIEGLPASERQLTSEEVETARYKTFDPHGLKAQFPALKDRTEEVPIIKGPRNDWWFITSILRNFGYTIVVAGEYVQIRDPVKLIEEGAAKKKTFSLKGKIDPLKSIFPILNFESPTTAVFLAQGVGGYVSTDVGNAKGDGLNNEADSKSGAVKTNDAEAGKTNIGKGTGKDTPKDITSGTREGGIDAKSNLPASPTDIHAEAVKGEYVTKATGLAVEVNIETLGIPNLTPEEIITITGFSANDIEPGIYDADYRIIEVTHQIGTSGYTTSFKALSTTTPKAIKRIYEETLAASTSSEQKIKPKEVVKRNPAFPKEKYDEIGVDRTPDINVSPKDLGIGE